MKWSHENEEKFISNYTDLYKLSMQDFMQLDLIKEKSAFNIFNSIQESKNRPLNRLITALGIRHVGKETADILAGEFPSLDYFHTIYILLLFNHFKKIVFCQYYNT